MVEVTVVIVLLAIVGGVAYARFGGVSDRRRTGAAEAALANVVVAQQQLFSDYGTYTSQGQDLLIAGATLDLRAGEPSESTEQVSMSVGTAGSLGLAVRVSSDQCRVVRVAPMTSGGAQTLVPVGDVDSCAADLAFEAPEVPAQQVAPVRPNS